MKKTIVLILFLLITNNAFSQEGNKKIYFLADTINTPKKIQVLSITALNVFEYMFTFYCTCAPPYKNYVSFTSIIKKGEKKVDVLSEKPDYPYLSFKELMDLAAKYHRYFDNTYDLFITEALPKNKYKTYKVKFVAYSAPRTNSVILRDKQ